MRSNLISLSHINLLNRRFALIAISRCDLIAYRESHDSTVIAEAAHLFSSADAMV